MIYRWVRERHAGKGESRVVDTRLRDLRHGNIYAVRVFQLVSIRNLEGGEEYLTVIGQ